MNIMNTKVTIRRVQPHEATTLSNIARQTFYDTFTGTCTEQDMQHFLDTVFSTEQLAKELANPDDHCFFAETGANVAGYLRFMEDYGGLPLMRQWKALELKRIYVTKEYQGKGVAQQLMDFYINFANQHEYTALWLGVWEHNERAKKFYVRYGFTDSGHTHDFPIGDTPQTDNWYWKFTEQ